MVEIEEPEEVLTGDIFPIEILEGSEIEGSPDYEPDAAVVEKGNIIEWTNADSVFHTVTSKADFGETFDSVLIDAGDVYLLDTSKLDAGEYEYFCSVHPWMVATITIE